MKPYLLFMAFLVSVYGDAALAETPSSLTVTLVPLRKEYHLGEPVVFVMSMKNSSSEPVQVNYKYPVDIGMSFTCKDPAAISRAGRVARGGRVPFVTVAPNGEFRRLVALNRYLTFSKPGRYSVSYSGLLMSQLTGVEGQKDECTIQKYKTSGTLDITIEQGPIGEKWIKELAEVLVGKGQPATAEDHGRKDTISKEEAAELLRWAETPLAIAPLVSAAENLDSPFLAAQVVLTRQELSAERERALNDLPAFEEERRMDVIQAAFADSLTMYAERGVSVPGAWFKPVLRSQDIKGIRISLEYLRNHGKKEDVEHVEPLTRNKNPQIAALAKQVVEELKNKKPSATSPAIATRPE